jgi:23S rRNA pseudouridine2457 synthase
LKEGVLIKLEADSYYKAVPHSIERVNDPLLYYPYAQDDRMSYPHSWLLITLTEGKYRQVRKMVLSVKHRCLRLIRLSIEEMKVEGIKPGEVKEVEEKVFFRLLQLD